MLRTIRPTRLADEVAVVWAMALVVAVATFVTYARLPAGATYHFDSTGIGGGLGRVLVYLNFPVALAAIAVAASIRDRLPSRTLRAGSAAAAALCAVAALPGVVSADDLTPRWINVVPAAGVVALLALSVVALRRPRPFVGRLRGDGLRVVLGTLLVLGSLPWLAATIGLYASDTPLVGGLWRAHEPTPGHPALASVHLALRAAPLAYAAGAARQAAPGARPLPLANAGLRGRRRGAGRLERAGREAWLDRRRPARRADAVARRSLGRTALGCARALRVLVPPRAAGAAASGGPHAAPMAAPRQRETVNVMAGSASVLPSALAARRFAV
jgi:hypothetical protein